MTQENAGHVRGSRITLESVEKVFGVEGDKPFQALSPDEHRHPAGEFVSIVGPSGCGKSTLLLMVAGLLKASGGRILVDGKEPSGPLTDVGIAFQDHLLLDFRTAIDNVMLQAEVAAPSARRSMRARAEALRPARPDHNRWTATRLQLSGGMRQRVSLVRALVHEPSVLLMDEPFGALDALTRLQVRYDLEQLWMAERPTVLFITHSVEEAVGLADRVFVMSPSPGVVVEEMHIDLPRPRPLALGEAPELAAHASRIYDHFDRLGVIHRGPAGQPAEISK